MLRYHRCTICNKTDNDDAINDLDDFTLSTFVADPTDPNFDICMECLEGIQDALFEFDEEEIDLYEGFEDN